MAKKKRRRPRAVPAGAASGRALERAGASERGRGGRGDGGAPRDATAHGEDRPGRGGGGAPARSARKEEARHQREQIRKRVARRRRTRQGGIALAVVVLIGVAAFLVTRSGGTSTPKVEPGALTAVFTEYLGKGARVAALFTYAVVITVIGVIVIIALARIATRIGAEPLEFKYPAPKKD